MVDSLATMIKMVFHRPLQIMQILIHREVTILHRANPLELLSINARCSLHNRIIVRYFQKLIILVEKAFEYKYVWRDRNVSSALDMIECAARIISII